MAVEPISPSNSNAPHLGPFEDDGRSDRDRFGSSELAIVLSHYDVGVIRRIRAYPRGSRRSPKLRVSTDDGEYLLKRRAPGKDETRRVAFAHELQQYLEQRDFPVAGLIPTRSNKQTMLLLHGRTYELFRFVTGHRDDRSLGAAEQAGRALGDLHRLLNGYEVGYRAPTGSYHASPTVEGAMRQTPTMIAAAGPADPIGELEQRCAFLREAYLDASRRAEEIGVSRWDRAVIHGDWHPGNLLYREGAVVAVLDFDSARAEHRVIDIANAALQFSMRMDDANDLSTWSSKLDVERIRALLRGYDRAAGSAMSHEERLTLPWLMIEALVLESILPIAATGSFGSLSGSAFLRAIERKVKWLRPRAAKLVEYLES